MLTPCVADCASVILGRWMIVSTLLKAEQLAQMGFDKARALEILDIVDGNVDLALDMLSS
jgi:hypothetical protein